MGHNKAKDLQLPLKKLYLGMIVIVIFHKGPSLYYVRVF